MNSPEQLACRPWLPGLLMACTSSGLVQKHAGTTGLLVYLLGAVAVFILLGKYGLPFSEWLRKHSVLTAGAAFIAFAVCFAILYPMEDSRGPGKSSDRDQGLNISAENLMRGEYPYYADAPDAGPLSVLPGAIILASPFVAAGNSAYQNLFWLAASVLLAGSLFRDRMLALALVSVSLAISPSAMHEFISGGDLLTNGIFVAAFSILALRAWMTAGAPTWWRWIAPLLFGIALASRPNFLFILPLFGALLWQQTSFGKALAVSSAAFLAFSAVTIPFYLWNPDGFTPLVARAKIEIPGMPWASAAVIAMTAAITIASSIALLLRGNGNPVGAFARHCVLVLAAPMLVMVVLRSIAEGRADFGFMADRFGLMYIPFAWAGWQANLMDGTTRKTQTHAG